MDALKSERIIDISQQANVGMVIHDTSVSYIQTLLLPFATEIENITDIDTLIKSIFPQTLFLKGHIIEYIYANIKSDVTLNNPEDIAAAKNSVIEYLVLDIVELAGHSARESRDSTIIPWDIQKVITNSGELPEIFGVRQTDKYLPVTVELVQGNPFIHELTEIFFGGLLLFSAVSGSSFNISMFGVPFLTDYILNGNNRFVNLNGGIYRVEIAGSDIYFNSNEFMQGFITGASWIGVDHHLYWKDLTELDDNGKLIPLTF